MYKDYEVKLNAILDSHKGVQKVELKSIDDLVNATKKADKVTDEILKLSKETQELFLDVRELANKFNSTNKKYNTSIKKGKEEFKNLTDVMKKVEKTADDLGVSFIRIPEAKKAVNSQADIRSAANDTQKYDEIKI